MFKIPKFPGFTLIELLVVISIIGILAALLLANFAGIRDRADDSRRKSNFKQLQNALRLRYNDTGSYNNNYGGALDTSHVGTTFLSAYADTNLITGLNLNSGEWGLWGSGDRFVACVQLLNSNDREKEVANGKCSSALSVASGMPSVTGSTAYFCVCAN